MPKTSLSISFHMRELPRVPEVSKISFQPKGNSLRVGKIFLTPREHMEVPEGENALKAMLLA